MSKSWFITGTDTSVGKTIASCALLQALSAKGHRVSAYKPVASGCDLMPEGWRNSDALSLQANSSLSLTYGEVNPVAFKEPTSPHIAAVMENRQIDIQQLSDGLDRLSQKSDVVIIEGAGGWYTPLNERECLSDWVIKEKLNVILVVGIKLGCINHALLTQRVLMSENIHLSGWIANSIEARNTHYNAYIDTLKSRLNAPLIGEIPYLSGKQKSAPLAQYIYLNQLV